MEIHVFAVWDFMSLLKALQREITCVNIPWRPSQYPAELVRFINEIVLGEESDVDSEGRPSSHFDLYLKAMEEVGASTSVIKGFLASGNLEDVPLLARDFVRFNLGLAERGHVVEVASAFFFGREKLIPEMFQALVKVLEEKELRAPTLRYYFERHIQLDGEEHGPLAEKCLSVLTAGNTDLEALAWKAGTEALRKRDELWTQLLHTFSTLSNQV